MAPPQAIEGWAQPLPETQPLDNRPPIDQLQQPSPWVPGFKAGAFNILPSVTAAGFYDDNIYASSSNRRGSLGGILRPELGITTAGSTYTLEARGNAERKWYSNYTNEGTINSTLGLAGTLMPDSNTQLVGKVRYARGHEDRGGGESLVTAFDEPLGNDSWEASGTLNKRFGRFWTSLGLASSWSNYDTATIGGVPVSQAYRDGNVNVLSGRVGYVVAPLTSVFVEVAGNRRKFGIDDFSSRGYRVSGGLLLEPGENSRFKGEVFAGYMNQEYNGATFEKISTFTYGGAMAYSFTPRVALVVEGRRNALESALNGGVSLIESLGSARLDYAITPNFIVGAGGSYLVDEFKGAGRTDHSLSPLVSAKYLVNPFLSLGFDYRNVNFDSNGTGVSTFYRNVYLLSINGKL